MRLACGSTTSNPTEIEPEHQELRGALPRRTDGREELRGLLRQRRGDGRVIDVVGQRLVQHGGQRGLPLPAEQGIAASRDGPANCSTEPGRLHQTVLRELHPRLDRAAADGDDGVAIDPARSAGQ